MFRRFYFITIIFLLFTACGSEVPQLSRLPADAVILAFGDSLTKGNGAKDNESYPAVLSQLTGLTVINAGISGEVSENGLRRLPGALAQHNPQLLILCHGGNDFLRKKSMTDMEANIRSMIKLAQDKSIPVVLIGVPEPALFLSSYEAYEEIAESMGVVFIDDLIPDILGDNDLKFDTVHPNAAGYKVMAETIYATLKDSGAI